MSERFITPRQTPVMAPLDDLGPDQVAIEGTRNDDDLMTHIERINRAPSGTINPAHIPGLGVPH
jgi:hypothetical protein